MTYPICCICSSGGHLHQLKKAVQNLKRPIFWISEESKHTHSQFQDLSHSFIINPHLSKLKYLASAIQAFFILLRVRPKVIISTGAGIAIPMILIGKYLFRCKIIFIESAADVVHPAKTPSLIYKYADLFIVQWEDMLKVFPRAKCSGVL